jgi:hypothetical protein
MARNGGLHIRNGLAQADGGRIDLPRGVTVVLSLFLFLLLVPQCFNYFVRGIG